MNIFSKPKHRGPAALPKNGSVGAAFESFDFALQTCHLTWDGKKGKSLKVCRNHLIAFDEAVCPKGSALKNDSPRSSSNPALIVAATAPLFF